MVLLRQTKMKAFVLTFVFFACMYVCSNAQDKKNELRTGSPGAYFFDEKPFRWYKIQGLSFLTYFSFRRYLGSNHVVSIAYSSFFLPYGIPERYFYKDEILKRHFRLFEIAYLYRLNIGTDFTMLPISGLKYRFRGGELFHEIYVNHGSWIEQHSGYRFYHDFGLSAGLSAKYRFWKNLNIGISADYTRYFAEASPYQLTTMVSIGYAF
jgi:hypothetical protein